MNVWYKIPPQQRRLTLATIVTLLRLLLIPFLMVAMLMHAWNYAFGIFIGAALSDGIDGYLARSRDEKTLVGAALDAMADKILIIACFSCLAFIESPLFTIPLWFVLCVLLKEAVLIGGVVFLAHTTGQFQIKPTWLGKGTMVAQVGFITWLFSCYFFHWLPIKTYYIMLAILMGLVIASLLHYLYLGMCFFATVERR